MLSEIVVFHCFDGNFSAHVGCAVYTMLVLNVGVFALLHISHGPEEWFFDEMHVYDVTYVPGDFGMKCCCEAAASLSLDLGSRQLFSVIFPSAQA